MQGYNRCKVIFDPNLSETEIDHRLEAIRLMSGVLRVETEATDTLVPGPRPEKRSGSQEGVTIELERRLSGSQIEAQRELIHRALIWGISAGRMTAAQIKNLDPEQMVALAFEMIDLMPEDQKMSLGRDFGKKVGE
ncbi:MAG: hypothetical protein A2527_00455 [Candidatus Lambdaproteobacteria bacterium RIFOXYD2_FULL_50_16]|uniref:Uncharacterized protein n=1 Tax=Candidatus Lambdaproteobacteria bacterium RIFOXYD2_FULL_50_16 TaxID=1817772 RepID=A0A1F6GFJ7_9PROT|nr:MAG: hypothetical protein A2527_00455 [Candidatus Lambdaproteobacteria bacterium RIFOXYD2_FULL_50_16]